MKFKFDLNDTLKAEEILSEMAWEEAVKEAAKLEGRLKIPVTMRGIQVGYGELHRDGTFIVKTESTPEGRELMQRLLEGTANCISIGPNPAGPVIRTISSEGV